MFAIVISMIGEKATACMQKCKGLDARTICPDPSVLPINDGQQYAAGGYCADVMSMKRKANKESTNWISCHEPGNFVDRNRKAWEIREFRIDQMTRNIDATLTLGYEFPMRIKQIKVRWRRRRRRQ